MSRWDNLKCGEGEERERHNKGSRFSCEKRLVYSDSNKSHDFSRQQKYKTSSKDRHQNQQKLQQQRNDRTQHARSSKTEAVLDEKMSILITEYHTLVHSLESQLFQYQFEGGNKGCNKLDEIENLAKLLRDTSNTNQSSTANERPYNTDVLMALLDLLQIAEEARNFDDNYNFLFSAVLTIESFLKLTDYEKKTNMLSKINLTKSQVESGITILSSHYKDFNVQPTESQSSMNSSLLVAIALLVRYHVCELPPESTARSVVGAIFIPFLSSIIQDRNQGQGNVHQSESMTTFSLSMHTIECVCEATIALLDNPSHASAILAPLVEDFSIQLNYGIEEQRINPLRMKLLWALVKCLKKSHGRDTQFTREVEEQAHVCRLLCASINAIQRLRKGDETNNSTCNDADVKIIKPLEKFILDIVKENNSMIRSKTPMGTSFEYLMIELLQLLRALVSCFPKEMIGTGWKLIIEGANRNVNSALSRTTGFRGMNSPVTSSYLPLLLLVHNESDTAIQRHEVNSRHLAIAIDCLADFVLVLPWNKWLKQSGRNHNRQHGYNTKGALKLTPTKAITSGLYKTVVDALSALIGISKNVFFKYSTKSLMKSVGRLAKSLMLEIPYCDIKLLRAGEDLWEAIVKAILPTITSSNTDLDEEKGNMAYEVLIASSGGTVTPQGNLRGMTEPARAWFLSENPSSELFINRLLDSFKSTNCKLNRPARILSSVLRTLPDLALQRWDTLLKIFEYLDASNSKYENGNSKDLLVMEVLESFMLGRKDFDVSIDLKQQNDMIITDLGGIMLKRWNRGGPQRCIRIYSTFRGEDWRQLGRIHSHVLCHFKKILSECHNSNAKIREGAARAVAEFCTQYILCTNACGIPIGVTKTQYRSIIHEVHAAMLELSRDKNAGVRSMSIFSVGNLASALKESTSKNILDTSKLHEMTKATLYSFNDTNDKVVKNAIRSVGHTINLLASSMIHEGDEHFSMSCKLLEESIAALTRRLRNALHVALNEEQKAKMTWKERSAAKKHGWGACHSLGLVFEGLRVRRFEECKDLVSACSKAVQCLVMCPCHYTVLNEKVVLAAMAAMCHLPCKYLHVGDSHEIVLGDALKISILILESAQDARINNEFSKASNKKAITPKLAAQNEKFLRYLLNSASITDATWVLIDDRITTQTLDILYSWMVEGLQLDGISASAFEIFAVALQQSMRWSASVGLEQQFASRALQKVKQERISKNPVPAENSCSPAYDKKDEDEADEL